MLLDSVCLMIQTADAHTYAMIELWPMHLNACAFCGVLDGYGMIRCVVRREASNSRLLAFNLIAFGSIQMTSFTNNQTIKASNANISDCYLIRRSKFADIMIIVGRPLHNLCSIS
jgi:hypothetical protein